MLLRELLYGHCQTDMAVLHCDWLCLSWSEPWRLLTSLFVPGAGPFRAALPLHMPTFNLVCFEGNERSHLAGSTTIATWRAMKEKPDADHPKSTMRVLGA